MKKLVVLCAAATLFVAFAAVPASAGVDANPNAVPFGPGTCENGDTWVIAYTPTAQAFSGHNLETGERGAGMSVWLVASDGTKIAPVRTTPGKGLENRTLWCWWEAPGTPTGYLGGDLLLNINGR